MWASRRMPTCCAMLAATSSPMMDATRARSRRISGTATFRTLESLDVQLARVPLLDLVEVAPVGFVRVAGLAIAELGQLAGEVLALLGRHRIAGLARLLHSAASVART